MFQVGANVFAAEVRDAVRIGSLLDVPPEELVLETALGAPFSRQRGIVIAAPDGAEWTLVVDGVLGVRTVPEEDLQPLPAFAAVCIQSAAVAGLVLLDEAPTPLVDLGALLRERPIAAPPTLP
jgi:chemotaxis signal transduction protein